MKDATKERQMDEELLRRLEIVRSAIKATEPLQKHMEHVKALNEAYPVLCAINTISSMVQPTPIVTIQQPLRAQGCQSRDSGAPLPPLELRTAQNTGAPSTQTTPRSGLPNYENEKQRTTNLERAVRAAMESMHRATGRYATLDELIDYLKESDETGYILGAIGDGLAWRNTKEERSTTGRRGILKHWKKYAAPAKQPAKQK